MEFDWEESREKRKHFYVFAGYSSDRLGFVTFQRNGWKAKSYMPGSHHRICPDLETAQEFVQEQIKAFIKSISAEGAGGITRQFYREATGANPVHDDLERANCPKAGQLGHFACGWNTAMNLPYTMTPRPPGEIIHD